MAIFIIIRGAVGILVLVISRLSTRTSTNALRAWNHLVRYWGRVIAVGRGGCFHRDFDPHSVSRPRFLHGDFVLARWTCLSQQASYRGAKPATPATFRVPGCRRICRCDWPCRPADHRAKCAVPCATAADAMRSGRVKTSKPSFRATATSVMPAASATLAASAVGAETAAMTGAPIAAVF